MNIYPVPGVYPAAGSGFIKRIAERICLLGRSPEIEEAIEKVPYPDLEDVPEDAHESMVAEYNHEVDLVREHFCCSGKAKHWLLETEDGLSLQYVCGESDKGYSGKVIVTRSTFSTLCGVCDENICMGDLFNESESVRAFCLSPELHAKATPYRNDVQQEPEFHTDCFYMESIDDE